MSARSAAWTPVRLDRVRAIEGEPAAKDAEAAPIEFRAHPPQRHRTGQRDRRGRELARAGNLPLLACLLEPLGRRLECSFGVLFFGHGVIPHGDDAIISSRGNGDGTKTAAFVPLFAAPDGAAVRLRFSDRAQPAPPGPARTPGRRPRAAPPGPTRRPGFPVRD